MAWLEHPVATERLTLRALVESDKPLIIAMRSDPDVRRYLGGPAGDDEIDSIRSATVGERWGVFCIADRVTDQPIGSVGFDRGRGELEVSYELVSTRWGRGLGAEAVAAALEWAAAHTDDGTVIAVTQTANVASVAMLGRLGFEFERTFVEFEAEQGWFRRPLHHQPTSG